MTKARPSPNASLASGMEEYKFAQEPLANPESVIQGSQYRFTILDDRVLRYEWAEDGVFEDRASTFVIFRKFPKPEFRVKDSAGQLEIITSSYHLTYDKKRFSPNGLVVSFSAKLTNSGVEWRYGQQQDDSNLGGTARTLDGVDGRCDMGSGIISRAGYAAVDDSESMLFGDKWFLSPRKEGDRIDGYLFSYGLDFKGAMESFYAVSGHQPSVPRWSLGNWWSRYHAYTEDEYLQLMRRFKDEEIPLSVAVIDKDWHWVEQDFVSHSGWTGYSWNTDLFPDPKSFMKALHNMNLKTTLNDHPRDGVHRFEDVYPELARVLGEDTKHGDPIAFDPTSPKFMHAYFNVVHRDLEKDGCDFWWIDWQQGLTSRIPGFDPLWALNHFQYLDTRKKSESASIIFSRHAGLGSHRYPVGFSGDTVVSWASLQFQPEFTATASNVGFGWWSHDIGGHMTGSRDDECTSRWVQSGVFSPILRLHSTSNRWMSKEPWLYRSEHMLAIRDAMKLRHRLVPYIYSTNASTSTRLPLVQPLYWRYAAREVAYQYPNQFFFSPSMVVSPITVPRDPRTNLAEVKIWIPPHRHVDMFTGTVYDGDREIRVYRSIDQVPVLLPEGSIVPLDGEAIPKNGCPNPSSFEVLVVVGQDGQFELIEDCSDDSEHREELHDQRLISITYDQAKGQLSCDASGKAWIFRFISTSIALSDIKVFVNGEAFAEAKVETMGVDLVVKVPGSLRPADTVNIELGCDPQLAVLDHTETWSRMLLNYQIEFKTKDEIWDILRADQSTVVKLGRLLSLGLEEVIYGPIAELMMADSR